MMDDGNLKPAVRAKLAAFHDIAEECQRVGHGQNYLFLEKEICAMVGIKVPDFRIFNGGHNKKKQP